MRWDRGHAFSMSTTRRQKGFISVTLIAIGVVVAIAGGVGFIFKDEILEQLKKNEPQEQEEVAPVNIPFPTHDPGPPGEPGEPSVDVGQQGKPIATPNITATGEWHGNYTVAAPDACRGVEGGWEAFITEDGGVVSGQFTADAGFGGSVSGTRSGATTTWNVGSTNSGISFRGEINGNTVSGMFTGVDCPIGGRTSGGFFGGRIVQ